jgi:hypothetical protein
MEMYKIVLGPTAGTDWKILYNWIAAFQLSENVFNMYANWASQWPNFFCL